MDQTPGRQCSTDAEGRLLPPDPMIVDIDDSEDSSSRPSPTKQLSSPTYDSPLRHHTRTHSAHRQVKETLNAHSEYTNSEDDGVAQHRINQYLIEQEIGRGSFGSVHLAEDQFGTEYAVKEFSKSRLRRRAQSNILRRPRTSRPGQPSSGRVFNSNLFRRSASKEEDENPLYLIREEIAIMKKLNHPNLVSLIEVLDDPDEDSLYMVLEYCKKGVIMKVGVEERADPYDEELCRTWFRDLILGIEYLHTQGIVHRDIKPDNLLLTEDDILKVVDFGVSEMFEKQSEMLTQKSAGSPAFMPPELCTAKHGGISGRAADIWSMGVTLYCLRFGHIPFEKLGVLDLYESIKNDDVKCDGECSEAFKDLIYKLLEKDPTKRITMPDLREHPWVTKGGSDPLLSAEENTSDLVDPPTEEELKAAITGNMSKLVVVMRAVKKFKRLVQKHPYFMGDIFPGERMVQPPFSMKDPASRPRKSQSADAYDHQPLGHTFAAAGIHHDLKPPFMATENTLKHSGVTSTSPSTTNQSSHSGSGANTLQRNIRTDNSAPRCDVEPVGKGQAHDPLDDHLFLGINTPTNEDPLDEPVVCESPPATDIDIFQAAYRDEIGRLRKRNDKGLMLYLTRRVEGKEEFARDETLAGRKMGEMFEQQKVNLSGLIDRAREKIQEVSPEPEGEKIQSLSDLVEKAREKMKELATESKAKDEDK